jgi:hypothetical protein
VLKSPYGNTQKLIIIIIIIIIIDMQFVRIPSIVMMHFIVLYEVAIKKFR